MRNRRRGFTLIEALGTIFILTLGIVSVTGALSALSRGESRIRQQDFIQALADRKYEELLATSSDLSNSASGNFEDEGISGYEWSMESADSGIDSLQVITVTVQLDNAIDRDPTGVASGLVYVPTTSTTATGGTQ